MTGRFHDGHKEALLAYYKLAEGCSRAVLCEISEPRRVLVPRPLLIPVDKIADKTLGVHVYVVNLQTSFELAEIGMLVPEKLALDPSGKYRILPDRSDQPRPCECHNERFLKATLTRGLLELGPGISLQSTLADPVIDVLAKLRRATAPLDPPGGTDVPLPLPMDTSSDDESKVEQPKQHQVPEPWITWLSAFQGYDPGSLAVESIKPQDRDWIGSVFVRLHTLLCLANPPVVKETKDGPGGSRGDSVPPVPPMLWDPQMDAQTFAVLACIFATTKIRFGNTNAFERWLELEMQLLQMRLLALPHSQVLDWATQLYDLSSIESFRLEAQGMGKPVAERQRFNYSVWMTGPSLPFFFPEYQVVQVATMMQASALREWSDFQAQDAMSRRSMALLLGVTTRLICDAVPAKRLWRSLWWEPRGQVRREIADISRALIPNARRYRILPVARRLFLCQTDEPPRSRIQEITNLPDKKRHPLTLAEWCSQNKPKWPRKDSSPKLETKADTTDAADAGAKGGQQAPLTNITAHNGHPSPGIFYLEDTPGAYLRMMRAAYLFPGHEAYLSEQRSAVSHMSVDMDFHTPAGYYLDICQEQSSTQETGVCAGSVLEIMHKTVLDHLLLFGSAEQSRLRVAVVTASARVRTPKKVLRRQDAAMDLARQQQEDDGSGTPALFGEFCNKSSYNIVWTMPAARDPTAQMFDFGLEPAMVSDILQDMQTRLSLVFGSVWFFQELSEILDKQGTGLRAGSRFPWHDKNRFALCAIHRDEFKAKGLEPDELEKFKPDDSFKCDYGPGGKSKCAWVAVGRPRLPFAVGHVEGKRERDSRTYRWSLPLTFAAKVPFDDFCLSMRVCCNEGSSVKPSVAPGPLFPFVPSTVLDSLNGEFRRAALGHYVDMATFVGFGLASHLARSPLGNFVVPEVVETAAGSQGTGAGAGATASSADVKDQQAAAMAAWHDQKTLHKESKEAAAVAAIARHFLGPKSKVYTLETFLDGKEKRKYKGTFVSGSTWCPHSVADNVKDKQGEFFKHDGNHVWFKITATHMYCNDHSCRRKHPQNSAFDWTQMPRVNEVLGVLFQEGATLPP